MSARERSVGELHPEDVIPDARLDQLESEGDSDKFGHRSIAARVAELVVASRQNTNVALFGPWGSGKSSFFSLLREELRELGRGGRVVRYDAWRSTGENLQTHFLASVWDELKPGAGKPKERLYNARKTIRFDPVEAVKLNGRYLGAILLTAAVVWLLLSAISTGVAFLGENPDGGWLTNFVAEAKSWFTKVAGLAVVITAAIKLADLAKVTVDEAAPSRSEQFREIFKGYVDEVTDKPLIVFVDELDRCAPSQVLAVLAGLRTFLETRDCSFVVAFDREAVVQAIGQDLRSSRPMRPNDPQYSTAGEFLDKIFQYQISLPPKQQYTLRRFAHMLVEKRGGLWAELRSHSDPQKLDRVVFTLTPAHVRSPRRVKVLLNSFALTVRTMEGRGIPWIDRAEEVAFLVVLRTEFPRFADDLLRVPDLVDLVLGTLTPRRPSQQVVVDRWMQTDEAPVDQAADELLAEHAESQGERETDRAQDSQVPERTAGMLNAQLHMYLRRTRGTPVPSPTADLVWMLERTDDLDIGDPELRSVLSLAADREPGFVAERFREESVSDQIGAVRRLSALAGEEDVFGQGQVLRELCLIAEFAPVESIANAADQAGVALAAFFSNGGEWTAAMIPGGLRLVARQEHQEQAIGQALLFVETADDEVKFDLLTRIAPSAHLLSTSALTKLGEIAARHAITDVAPLVSLSHSSDCRVLEAVFSSHNASQLTAASRIVNPKRADTTGMTATAINAAKTEYDKALAEVKEQRNAMTTRMRAIVDGLLMEEGREIEADGLVIGWGIDLVQRDFARNPLPGSVEYLRELFEVSASRAPRQVLNRAALRLLTADPSRAEAWSAYLADGPLEDDDAEAALVALLDHATSEEAEPDSWAGCASASRRIAELGVGHDMLILADRYEKFVTSGPGHAWDVTEHRTAAEIALTGSMTDRTLELVATDFARGPQSITDPGDWAALREWAAALPPLAAATALEQAQLQEDMPSELRAQLLHLRCVLVARLRALGEEADLDDAGWFAGLDRDDVTTELVSDWIALASSWAQAEGVWKSTSWWPRSEAVDAFSRRLTSTDRAALWSWLLGRETPIRVLKSVAGAGLDAVTLDPMLNDLRDTSSNHQTRKAAVDRLLALNVSLPAERSVLVGAVEELARKKRGIDFRLAVTILRRIQEANRLSADEVSRLRPLMQPWMDAHAQVLNKQEKSLLDHLDLATEKKSGLADVASRLLRGDKR